MDNTRWLKSMGDTRKVTFPYKRGILEVHVSKDYTLSPEEIKEIYQAAKGAVNEQEHIYYHRGNE